MLIFPALFGSSSMMFIINGIIVIVSSDLLIFSIHKIFLFDEGGIRNRTNNCTPIDMRQIALRIEVLELAGKNYSGLQSQISYLQKEFTNCPCAPKTNVLSIIKKEIKEELKNVNTTVGKLCNENFKKSFQKQEAQYHMLVFELRSVNSRLKRRVYTLHKVVNLLKWNNSLLQNRIEVQEKDLKVQKNNTSNMFSVFETFRTAMKKQIDDLKQQLDASNKKIKELETFKSKASDTIVNLKHEQYQSEKIIDKQSYLIIAFVLMFFIFGFVIWNIRTQIMMIYRKIRRDPEEVNTGFHNSIAEDSTEYDICCFTTSPERQEFCQNNLCPKLLRMAAAPNLTYTSVKVTSVPEANRLPRAQMYLLFLSEDARGMILESSHRQLRRHTLNMIQNARSKPCFAIIHQYRQAGAPRGDQLYNNALVQVQQDPQLQSLVKEGRLFTFYHDLNDYQFQKLSEYITTNFNQ